MTLLQTKLLKHLADADVRTIRDASIKAGYAKKSNKPYAKGIKGYIAEAIGADPKLIIARYEDLMMRCKANGDLSTERACLDSLARINGMNRDKQEITTKHNIDPMMSTDALKVEAEKVLERLKSQKVE